jgi:hypothetical protein
MQPLARKAPERVAGLVFQSDGYGTGSRGRLAADL